MTAPVIAAMLDALTCGNGACPCAAAALRGHGLVHCPSHSDPKPSLNVTERDGRVLVFCHGQCEQGAVIAALRERALWPGANGQRPAPAPRRPRELPTAAAIVAPEPEVPDVDEEGPNAVHVLTAPRPRELPRVEAIYPYPGIDGVVRYRVVRYADPKRFLVWHPNGAGWKPGLGGADTIPYRLPELMSSRPEVTVFVGEGEKVVDRLAAAGLVATTNPFGAGTGKWPAEWGATYLGGRRVVVLPDNDDIGRRHAVAVADSCVGPAAAVRILTLDGLPEHGDVVDWLDAGHGVAELLQLAEAAPEHRRAPVTRIEFPCTDMGNSERFVARHGEQVRYVATTKTWYVWDGVRWRPDDTVEVERRAKETARSIYAEAEGAGGTAQRKDLAAHAIRTEAAAKLAAMIDTARSDAMIAVRADRLDADPWLLNVANGTIDLRSGVLRPHDPRDLITKLAPVVYDPEARLALFDNFIAATFGGDADLMRYVQTAIGYSISGDTREETFFIAHGPTAAGKTTLAEAYAAALGDYAARVDPETFLAAHGEGGPRADIARLEGRRLVVAVEIDQGRRLDEGLVKQFVGGDTIVARELYRAHREYRPQAHLWFFANDAPRVRDDDDAIWRRARLVPFVHSVPRERRDPRVKIELRDPTIGGPAVLAWAVAGCLMWQRDGLGTPRVIESATERYRADMDPIADFLTERCRIDPDAWAPVDDLYQTYVAWAKAAGERRPLNKSAFGNRLSGHGFAADKGAHGMRIRRGVGIGDQQTLAGAERPADVRDEIPW